MSVGKAILRVRLDKKLTQSDVGRRAGLATSYISRIENGHIQPTVKTLGRLLEALGTDASEIFGIAADPLAEKPHRCPVSASGHCVGEMIRSHPGAPPKDARGKARYGPMELKLLRMADYIVLNGSQEVRRALKTVLESFVSRTEGGAARIR